MGSADDIFTAARSREVERDEHLDESQKRAVIAALFNHHPVTIITGPAGTGKSTTIAAMERYGRICKTATTGKAAMIIGGMTIDSLFCFERRKNEPYRCRNAGFLEWNMNQIDDTIVLDEASMVGKHMATYIAATVERYRKRLVMVGDWGQAMPVMDDWPFASDLFKEAQVVKLERVHRQKTGPYLDALNLVRQGISNHDVREVFRTRFVSNEPGDDQVVRWFGTNQTTNDYNLARVSTFPQPFWFTAVAKDVRETAKIYRKEPLHPDMLERYAEDSPFAHGPTALFAIGCRVVVTMNEPVPSTGPNGERISPVAAASLRRYVNGDTGRLMDVEWESCTDHYGRTGDNVSTATVLLDRTGEEVRIPLMAKVVKDAADRDFVAVVGIPLAIGYAMTIHKSQGSTVCRGYVDMQTIMSFPAGSRHGLAYVALSRTREIEGLQIANWDDRAIESDPAVRHLL